MTTTLSNYTIDDFIKLKPMIYEYCVNLTQKKTTTSWFRDFADADDLYQEVFLYVHDNYFNKPKEEMSEGKFIQLMKNCTYWAYHRRFTTKGHKLYQNLNRIDDSPKDLFLFEESHWENGKSYVDFTESIDFAFYTENLKPIEIQAVCLYLEGFLIKEIDKKFDKYPGWFEYLMRVKLYKNLEKDKVKLPKPAKPVKKELSIKLKENNEEFLRLKIPCFDEVFNFKKSNDKFIKMYSLYLQGVSLKDISKEFKIPIQQISVELYRIKQKIKKYDT